MARSNYNLNSITVKGISYIHHLARPNTIANIVYDFRDSAPGYNGHLTKPRMRSCYKIQQRQRITEEISAASEGNTAGEIIIARQTRCNTDG